MTDGARGPATLLLSPLASRIRGEQARARVEATAVAAIRARGHAPVVVVETGNPRAIRAAALSAVDEGTTLAAVAGGDGTVRDFAAGLVGTDIPLAILPCGTGNLYATAIGVPRSLDAAVAAIASGEPRPFDLGEVLLIEPPGASGTLEERDAHPGPITFAVACGTGFDASLIAATTREMKRRYGVAAYFLAAAGLLSALTPQATVLTVDGRRMELESVVVLVANAGEPIPGRLRPRLPIDAADGRLHVFVLPRGGVVAGLRGALELIATDRLGASSSGLAIRLEARSVRVEVTPAAPTQVDGDPYPPAWLEARVLPGALRVICP